MYRRAPISSAGPSDKTKDKGREDILDHNDGAYNWQAEGSRCPQENVEGQVGIFWSAGDLAGRVHRDGGGCFDLAWGQLLLQYDALPVHPSLWETHCGVSASKRQ